jgi:hypothetical protein
MPCKCTCVSQFPEGMSHHDLFTCRGARPRNGNGNSQEIHRARVSRASSGVWTQQIGR